ncbi:putative G-protein coupled receptor [Echinococcus granulosus]|uniref:GPCR family 3 C terminal n=1 Tax=Echinococcus granulosus TaxID=6210 RepID=U6IZV1_ECHGR|nr:putative G-protein coupled receptor [Echinococcus granulosus]EUB64329.1 putative G-protein coupled receptor [Echinococcus granulosus]KAH9283784.1 putative G-protein coupled receptor [Echinococcus granulosus]CDS17301.1 GPCR family 3 C terminal [Echinococcus granulosus]
MLLIIPIYCNNRELSRAESRRLLSLIAKTLHSPTSGCPDLLISAELEANQLPPKNYSYLLPFRRNYAEFLCTIVTPVALHNSYRWDIVRAASLAELVINWLSLKGLILVEGATGNMNFENFLGPLMRAFMQTSSYYSRSSRGGGQEDESAVNSVTICMGSGHLMYVEKSTLNVEGFASRPPGNLCALMTSILEGSILKPISSAIQMVGVWAPLHCNFGVSMPGKKIPLHLIIPVPHTKSASLVFEFDLRNLALDLCAVGLDYCRHSTTQCVYRQYQEWAFDVANYICQCKPGFYTDRPENGYPAELYMQETQKNSASGAIGGEAKGLWDRMSCKVCPPDCPNCTSSVPCGVEYNMHLLRGIPLAIQTFSITTTLLLGVLTFRLRRTRAFKAANWKFLEIFLLGAVLLYSTSIVMYFRASSSTCILLPWFREVGFALMYGVLIVKLYRVLICFQSRKAHRVHVRDKDLFKYLGCFVAIVIGYMLAWTAVTLDYTRFRNLVGVSTVPAASTMFTVQQPMVDDILVKGRIQMMVQRPTPSPPLPPPPQSPSSTHNATSGCVSCSTFVLLSNNTVTNLTSIRQDGEELAMAEMAQVGAEWQKGGIKKSMKDSAPSVHYQYFRVCRAMSWDIFVQLGEMAILLAGVHYCRLIWSAPSEYNENRCITIVFLTELIGSGTLYLTRHFIWYSTHPDVIYLIYFIRCHLTVTVNIAIIFAPKFWYIHRPPSPQVVGMVVGVSGGRRGMVGAVPGASAAPHLVPSNNKLRLASNGELDLADVNLADMDPEVIRRELKRLYTAIEIYKTKAMRRDNPHISKRRGGRKQRRFSLQPFHKKHHGGGMGDYGSGYQGDVSTISNIGGGERSVMRSGTGGGKSAPLGTSMVDEETSRVSEDSITSLVDATDQRFASQLGAGGRNRSKTQSSPHEYGCRQEITGCVSGGANDG